LKRTCEINNWWCPRSSTRGGVGSITLLYKAIKGLIKLQNYPILTSVILLITEHLWEFDIYLLLQSGLNEGFREVHLARSPSSLDGNIHHHPNGGPGGYRSVLTLKVVYTGNLLVSTNTKNEL
jgi:hypothetical protein